MTETWEEITERHRKAIADFKDRNKLAEESLKETLRWERKSLLQAFALKGMTKPQVARLLGVKYNTLVVFMRRNGVVWRQSTRQPPEKSGREKSASRKFTCKMHEMAWNEGQRPKLQSSEYAA